MALKIGLVSQKGGVGKSTLARLIACEYARNGWEVKIADMDTGQETSRNWHDRRIRNGITPEISVEKYSSVGRVLKVEDNFDLIVFDGGPRATSTTWEISKVSDVIVLPTGLTLDDLEPTVHLAHQLRRKDIPHKKIAIAFCRIGRSQAELREATGYIEESGYFLLDGQIPESTGYGRAGDLGHTLTETPYRSLNKKADRLTQAIIDRLTELTS